ncbi:MAG: DUF2779 domain-containing protein [Puniceicoccales bacterium]|nr:DUF2779 domain-containing protein [Puniceicoccales bacterium]
MNSLLTKSLFQVGLRCHRLLWFRAHRPDSFENDSQQLLDGIAIGNLAKELHPSGVEIDWTNFSAGLRCTQECMALRRPIFEAGFLADGCHARADILLPDERDGAGWDIVEVKSSSLSWDGEGPKIRQCQLYDLAFQKFCYEAAGVPIGHTFLLLLNRDYVRYGELHPSQIFEKVDCTEQVQLLANLLPKEVEKMRHVLAQDNPPPIAIRWNCKKNSRRENRCDCREDCFFKKECWPMAGIAAENITILPRFNGADLLEQGRWKLTDFTGRDSLTEGQKIVFDAAISQKTRLERSAIVNWLKNLTYPLHYLDFETFSSPIPPFDGTHAYSRIPFQFSLHLQRSPGSDLEHFGFLAQGMDDPRPAFLQKLRQCCKDLGSVVVYNASFERSVLLDLGEFLPDWRGWTEALCSRLVDLFEIFRRYHYYSPAQLGSKSIKKVLPALTGQSYAAMRIGNGGDAMAEYRRVTFSAASVEDQHAVRTALEEYCALDTKAMVDIIAALTVLVRKESNGNDAQCC